MGFLSRLFGRVQEEPLARPEVPPPAEAIEVPRPADEEADVVEPAAEGEPRKPLEPPAEEADVVEPPEEEPHEVAEPAAEEEEPEVAEPAEPDEPPPLPAARARRAPERPRRAPVFPPPPPPPEPEPVRDLPKELSLTLDEVIAALRGAGSDGIRTGFISREYLRAPEEERAAARRKLIGVLTEQLRARGLLAEDGTFELREEPTLAKTRGG